jgi:hypothetical protein
MGFLSDLGRALIGVTPPGEQPARTASANDDLLTGVGEGYYEGLRKIVPEVDVERLEAHQNGDRLELWAHVQNHSKFEVQVGRVNILGQHLDVGRFLKPGERNEVKIYAGAMPKDDSYHKAEFFFKIVKNGDYFCADHRIEYGFHDGHYVPEDLKIIHPIRDV